LSDPIQHQEHGHRGRFTIEREGQRRAEMTYSRAGESLVIIDHTEVDPELRGQGAGRALLDALVAWARQTHTR
jgi:predicted GNAT family acetyltransferase